MKYWGMKKKKQNVVKYKLLYTAIILLVYSIGKGLPLYMIDVSEYMHKTVEPESLLLQTIQGDVFQCSLFALGISPYMIASMLTQIISAFRKSEIRSKISPKKTNYQVLGMALVIAIIQAVVRVQGLVFRVSGYELLLAKVIAVVEMVTGAMIIVWLCSRNKKYGIGGQSALIFSNIVAGIVVTLKGNQLVDMLLPVTISILVMMVVILMENSEKRIPVQRISIHNIYADKNYLAIKLSPIGVMPAMFSSAAFMIPMVLFQVLTMVFPENTNIVWLNANMKTEKPLGFVIYLLLIYILSIGFSRVFINPGELTEQFLKSGDSLLNIHAGKDTKKYLSRTINRIAIVSATVMCICLCVPIVLRDMGVLHSTLASLPSSVLMLTGIWCNLNREVKAIKDLEGYQPFI